MSDQTILWRKLRTMPNTGLQADPDWRGTQVSPHRLPVTVGGTASNGVYAIRVRGTVLRANGTGTDVDETITMTRTTETNAQIATALAANAVASHRNLLLADIIVTANSTDVRIDAPPGCELSLTLTAPGTGTLTAPAGSTLPIVAGSPNFSGSRFNLGKVVVQVNAMDLPALLPPGVGTQTTFDMTVVEICMVRNATGVNETRIASTQTLTACQLATEYEFPIRGAGYWTVRLFNFANAVANTDAYEVIYRDATS